MAVCTIEDTLSRLLSEFLNVSESLAGRAIGQIFTVRIFYSVFLLRFIFVRVSANIVINRIPIAAMQARIAMFL